MSIMKRFSQYSRMARQVSIREGIPVARQVSEILHLSRFPGKIGPGDYYSYRLFEDSVPMAEKERFVGWRAESRLDALNESSWHCLGLDKVLMYSLFQSIGIRCPETLAVYLPGGTRYLHGAKALSTQEQLHSWLRTPSNYPFFSKPSACGFAKGPYFAYAYDGQKDCIKFRDGESIKIEDFEQGFGDIERLGYLFQTPLGNDSRLIDSVGRTLSSLRMIVLVNESHPPILHRCFWKLPTGSNTHDNYNGGRTGNLAAALDHETGRITRVINGTGLDVIEVPHHPDTGILLSTVAVPDWKEILDFTFRAALTFPKLRFQQWDIALTDDGPVALEVNLFGTGGCDLTQLLYRKGLLDDVMQDFLCQTSGFKQNMKH